MKPWFTIALAVQLLGGVARAADAPAPAPALDAEGYDPGCADSGPARSGVQKLDFLKRHRFEVTGWGGFFAGDLVSTSYGYGGALAYFLTEDFGVELSLLVTRFDLAVEKPLSQIFTGQRFVASTAFVLVADLIWSPVHLKVRASEHAIVHGDLVFALGAGDTVHDTVQGATFDVGLGLKIYPTRFFTIRFDLRDYLMIQEVISVQRTVNNLVGLVGVSFWIPPWQ